MSDEDREPGADQESTGFFDRGMTRRMLLKAGAAGVPGTATSTRTTATSSGCR